MIDDFDRDVYCLAGLPIDAVSMAGALTVLESAADNKVRCFLSTPNLNFLIASQHDPQFRNSVIQSDLVVADGMPLVWMAKLLGVPIRERVAGSSLFEALRQQNATPPRSVYFFGGPDGVAEIAATRVNQTPSGIKCVGYQSPGFVSVEEMSNEARITAINASNADFLVVSLGAKKGQAWILRNQAKINVPIISHLGAVVNFEANILQRAPTLIQKKGLEWLWRIKEEPSLWKRYWNDGLNFLTLLTTSVIPHAIWLLFNRQRLAQSKIKNEVHLECNAASCRLIISGVVLDPIAPETRALLRKAGQENVDVELDLTHAEYLSAGFLGLLLILKKNLDQRAVKLKIIGVQSDIARLLKWNGLADLLKQS